MTKTAIKTLINGIKALIPNPQVQSDYAENNSNSVSYIKNRPFYKDEETEEIKQIEEEFIPPVSAENVYFDEDLSNDYDGAQTVEEGFRKIIEKPWTINFFEIEGNPTQTITPIGNNNSIYLGIDSTSECLAKSKDGENWEIDYSTQVPFSSHIDNIYSYYYKDVWFIYNNSNLYFSKDLKNWEKVNILDSYTITGTLGEKDGALYACIGQEQSIGFIKTEDGINWKIIKTMSNTIGNIQISPRSTFACNNHGFIFETTSADTVIFSPDLENFQRVSVGGSFRWLQTVNNIFYFYWDESLFYSFNGIDWHYEVIWYLGSRKTIAYNGKFYITYNRHGLSSFPEGAYYSYDFINWKIIPYNFSAISPYGKVFAFGKTILFDKQVAKKEYNPLGLAMVSDLEDIDISEDLETLRNELNSKVDEAIEDIQKQVSEDYIILKDAINGYHYIIQMCEGKLTSFCRCASIQITKKPDKLVYLEGDIFDPTGMVVEAVAEDGTVFEINQYIYDNSPLIAGQQIKVIYTEMSKDFETTVEITVKPFDPEVGLVDFEYIKNDDGTYTITDWKGTYNGEKSTKLVIPNSSLIIV